MSHFTPFKGKMSNFFLSLPITSKIFLIFPIIGGGGGGEGGGHMYT